MPLLLVTSHVTASSMARYRPTMARDHTCKPGSGWAHRLIPIRALALFGKTSQYWYWPTAGDPHVDCPPQTDKGGCGAAACVNVRRQSHARVAGCALVQPEVHLQVCCLACSSGSSRSYKACVQNQIQEPEPQPYALDLEAAQH
eukprot:483246-Rhodomonas_salina.2